MECPTRRAPHAGTGETRGQMAGGLDCSPGQVPSRVLGQDTRPQGPRHSNAQGPPGEAKGSECAQATTAQAKVCPKETLIVRQCASLAREVCWRAIETTQASPVPQTDCEETPFYVCDDY